MSARDRRARVALVLALALPAGCAHGFLNERLERAAPDAGYRFERVATPSSLSVVLAFSGGGTRAAALGYGVLEELRGTTITLDGRARTMLDSVDAISAVSGGAFPAAYYGLFGDRVFDDFRARVLERDLQRAVEIKVLTSAWWLWADPALKRSDLAAELYDETVFDGRTFRDLEKRRPFVVINATDMSTGQRFEFTQDQFDLIGSDLASFPVGRAVAASAAVPFLLSTIRVTNHARLEGAPQGFALPSGISRALDARERDPRLFEWARRQAAYASPRGPSWLHLIDGGVTDNTGVRAIWTSLRRSDGFLRKQIEARRTKRLLVIVVNALGDPLIGVGERERGPNIASVVEKASRISVNTNTFESIRLLEEDARIKETLAAAGAEMTVVEVSFDRLKDDARADALRAIPTELRLSRADADALIGAGREVLRESPAFRAVVREIGGR